MKILLVYCHPCAESFIAAVRNRALAGLEKSGHQVQLVDLYAARFNPVMDADERCAYHTPGDNEVPVARYIVQIMWARAMAFVYPTWWFGLPAMLKGWRDRVWVPHVTFVMPENGAPAQPLMTHIGKLVVIFTCGAPWWMMKLVGNPGRPQRFFRPGRPVAGAGLGSGLINFMQFCLTGKFRMLVNKRKIRLIALSSIGCLQAGLACQTLRARRIWPLSALGKLENHKVSFVSLPSQMPNPLAQNG